MRLIVGIGPVFFSNEMNSRNWIGPNSHRLSRHLLFQFCESMTMEYYICIPEPSRVISESGSFLNLIYKNIYIYILVIFFCMNYSSIIIHIVSPEEIVLS